MKEMGVEIEREGSLVYEGEFRGSREFWFRARGG